MYIFASSVCLKEMKIPAWLGMRANQCFLTSSREKQRPSQGLILCNRNPVFIIDYPKIRTQNVNRSGRGESLHSFGYLLVSPTGSSGYSRTCGHPGGPESIGWVTKTKNKNKNKKKPQALKGMNVGKEFVKRQRDKRVECGKIG